jgi:hypothetical protein
MMIFAVSRGEYSDYKVVGIFTTEERRDAYLAEYQKLDAAAFAEEFELDPSPPDVAHGYYVEISRRGNVQEIQERHFRKDTPECERWDADLPGFLYFADDSIGINIIADTQETAIKTANEMRAHIDALRLWGNAEDTVKLIGGYGET